MMGSLHFFPGVDAAAPQPEKCLLVHPTFGTDNWSVSALWANIGNHRRFLTRTEARAFADRISAERDWPVREIGGEA
jgi:hypothetical protein